MADQYDHFIRELKRRQAFVQAAQETILIFWAGCFALFFFFFAVAFFVTIGTSPS